jgi:hypothetical protein
MTLAHRLDVSMLEWLIVNVLACEPMHGDGIVQQNT